MDYEDDAPASPVSRVLAWIAAVLALVMVGFGLWALGGAIYFAWSLFRDPGSIAFFVKYFVEATHITAHLPGGGEGLAHFVSWLAVILLLLVLGKLGAWAMGAAAQLLALRTRGRD